MKSVRSKSSLTFTFCPGHKYHWILLEKEGSFEAKELEHLKSFLISKKRNAKFKIQSLMKIYETENSLVVEWKKKDGEIELMNYDMLILNHFIECRCFTIHKKAHNDCRNCE